MLHIMITQYTNNPISSNVPITDLDKVYCKSIMHSTVNLLVYLLVYLQIITEDHITPPQTCINLSTLLPITGK